MSGRLNYGPLAIAMLAAVLGAAVSRPLLAQSEQPLHGGGVGLICMWVMANAAAEAGRHCRAGQNPALQAELDHTVRRFDDYVLRNSEATPAAIANLKSAQANRSHPDFCTQAGGLFEIYAQAGPDRLRREIDTILSRNPPVEWGTCL